jgi:hypothetical protein
MFTPIVKGGGTILTLNFVAVGTYNKCSRTNFPAFRLEILVNMHKARCKLALRLSLLWLWSYDMHTGGGYWPLLRTIGGPSGVGETLAGWDVCAGKFNKLSDGSIGHENTHPCLTQKCQDDYIETTSHASEFMLPPGRRGEGGRTGAVLSDGQKQTRVSPSTTHRQPRRTLLTETQCRLNFD